MKQLYLIGGPMGVGKTSVSRRLAAMLERSVLLDGDWCWMMHPFTVTDETKAMVMDNIAHLLGNFLRCSAVDHVVFCWVMHEQAIIDDLMSRLPLDGVQIIAVSLVCKPEALAARIGGDVCHERLAGTLEWVVHVRVAREPRDVREAVRAVIVLVDEVVVGLRPPYHVVAVHHEQRQPTTRHRCPLRHRPTPACRPRPVPAHHLRPSPTCGAPIRKRGPSSPAPR